MAHGKSLKRSITCKNCDKEFEVLPYRVENEDKKFCSSECQHNFQKNRIERSCDACDNTFEMRVSDDQYFCSWECRNEGLKNRTTSSCSWCGNSFEHHKSKDRRFCSVACTENWFSSEERPTSNGTGEEHWAYRGGGGSRWYGPNWKNRRSLAKSRVDKCEHPNCDKFEDLQCHHIVPFRYFVEGNGSVDYDRANDPKNLMMLCPKHHTLMDWKIRQVEEAEGYE